MDFQTYQKYLTNSLVLTVFCYSLLNIILICIITYIFAGVMWRKLLISFIILHVKLVVMQNLTTLSQNVQTESPSEADEDRLQLVTRGESINTQLLTHIQEILSSKQPTDQTTEVSSSDQDQQTIQDSSSYLDGTNNAITFLKELETGLPQSQDEVVPFKAVSSDYLKMTAYVEEGKKNETYSERFGE